MSTAHYDPDPKAHPGLRAIAILALAKGLPTVLAANGLELIGPASPRRRMDALVANSSSTPWGDGLAGRRRQSGLRAFRGRRAAAYAMLHLAKAGGLWRDRAWASWLGCVAAALYLLFDL